MQNDILCNWFVKWLQLKYPVRGEMVRCIIPYMRWKIMQHFILLGRFLYAGMRISTGAGR